MFLAEMFYEVNCELDSFEGCYSFPRQNLTFMSHYRVSWNIANPNLTIIRQVYFGIYSFKSE
ncbi:MAG: hypothetical protein OQK56_03930 [Ignavibacteriaceae bacterium]|nr:hypothetical protein [Ignavibacteriaceae bacterium]